MTLSKNEIFWKDNLDKIIRLSTHNLEKEGISLKNALELPLEELVEPDSSPVTDNPSQVNYTAYKTKAPSVSKILKNKPNDSDSGDDNKDIYDDNEGDDNESGNNEGDYSSDINVKKIVKEKCMLYGVPDRVNKVMEFINQSKLSEQVLIDPVIVCDIILFV